MTALHEPKALAKALAMTVAPVQHGHVVDRDALRRVRGAIDRHLFATGLAATGGAR